MIYNRFFERQLNWWLASFITINWARYITYCLDDPRVSSHQLDYISCGWIMKYGLNLVGWWIRAQHRAFRSNQLCNHPRLELCCTYNHTCWLWKLQHISREGLMIICYWFQMVALYSWGYSKFSNCTILKSSGIHSIWESNHWQFKLIFVFNFFLILCVCVCVGGGGGGGDGEGR